MKRRQLLAAGGLGVLGTAYLQTDLGEQTTHRVLGEQTLCILVHTACLVNATESTVRYEDARNHILAAVEPLGEPYKNRLEEFFTSQRIDVYETQNLDWDHPFVMKKVRNT